MTCEPVLRVLESLGAACALIGAHAMAARGHPRFAVDLNLLTTDRRVLDRAVWVDLERQGASVDAREGDADDPLAGVVHILLADGSDVDVVVGKWTWETGVIARADRMPVMGAHVAVPRTSDLVLLKLAAGGYQDLHDAAALMSLGDRAALVADVDAHVEEVRPDVRAKWGTLRASMPGPPSPC